MSFTRAFRNAEFRKRVTILAQSSGVGGQIEQNLSYESRVPPSSADGIRDALLAAGRRPIDLKEAYIAACRRYILEGPEMNGPRPGLLGRAVTARTFHDMLVKTGKFSTRARAEAKTTAWLRCSGPDAAYRMRRTPLGRYVMWATYCQSDRHRNPFELLPPGANDIRDVLGLDPADRKEPLLLFVYDPAPDVKLRFPTVADAQWSPAFRPAPDDPNIESGMALPLNKNLRPQPEVVHKPVLGDTMRAPIEERRP